MQHRDNVMKRQLQIELDPTNNIERDINKNTVHSCLQLKLFEQDVGLQVCKTTKYVTTLTIQYTLNRSRAWSTMSSSEVTPPTPLSPPLVVCLKAWMWLEKVVTAQRRTSTYLLLVLLPKYLQGRFFLPTSEAGLPPRRCFFLGLPKLTWTKLKFTKWFTYFFFTMYLQSALFSPS